jgi:KaiC/GvpD/RAD55 family RecA-like ATPase
MLGSLPNGYELCGRIRIDVTEYLSTGLDALDRQCGGENGIPAGSLVAIEAPPGVQVESMIWTMMTARPTVYVSTLRDEAALRDDLDATITEQDFTVHRAAIDTPIENAWNLLELVDQQVNVVVDPATPLERVDDEDRYVKFLNWLKNHLVNTGSIGILHCSQSELMPPGREMTLSIADLVWEIDTVLEGGTIENKLFFKKFRGHSIPEETIKLRLGERVSIDTSRDIA